MCKPHLVYTDINLFKTTALEMTLIHMLKGHTCLWLHREVRLPLEYAVDKLSAVPVRGVVCVRGVDFYHKST